jgi:hypothetical protein
MRSCKNLLHNVRPNRTPKKSSPLVKSCLGTGQLHLLQHDDGYADSAFWRLRRKPNSSSRLRRYHEAQPNCANLQAWMVSETSKPVSRRASRLITPVKQEHIHCPKCLSFRTVPGLVDVSWAHFTIAVAYGSHKRDRQAVFPGDCLVIVATVRVHLNKLARATHDKRPGKWLYRTFLAQTAA